MEEDIKILEDYIAFKRQFVLLNDETERYEAIENLIKGHKNCLNDYIPKSKIKEKIDAYSKSCAVVDAFIVDVLQELMEDK